MTASKPELMNRMLGVDQSRSPQIVGEHPDAIEGRDLTTRGGPRKVRVPADLNANRPTRSLPAYWAAFQLSGDPR